MLHGASIKISPQWIPESTIVDFQWDDDDPSTGKWWGDLALLGGTGSNEGEWEWDPDTQELELWVPVPGSARRLIAVLKPFTVPATTGMTGDGSLAPTLNVPATGPLEFTWETFAPDFFNKLQGA